MKITWHSLFASVVFVWKHGDFYTINRFFSVDVTVPVDLFGGFCGKRGKKSHIDVCIYIYMWIAYRFTNTYMLRYEHWSKHLQVLNKFFSNWMLDPSIMYLLTSIHVSVHIPRVLAPFSQIRRSKGGPNKHELVLSWMLNRAWDTSKIDF